jgi:hypothetical protein
MLPDLERAERIGKFWGYPLSRTFAGLLIDCEESARSRLCSSAGRPRFWLYMHFSLTGR